MRLTLPDLKTLIQDPEYRRLPRDIALRNQDTQESWGTLMDDLGAEGLKTNVWQLSELVAILFDTYGDAIRAVSIWPSIDQDAEDTYLSLDTMINDDWCYAHRIQLKPDDLAVCEDIDGCQTIKNVITEIEGLGNERLLPNIKELQEHLAGKFTSAQQARDKAQAVAPEIHAWVKARALGDIVAKARVEEAPAPKKKGPGL